MHTNYDTKAFHNHLQLRHAKDLCALHSFLLENYELHCIVLLIEHFVKIGIRNVSKLKLFIPSQLDLPLQ